MTTLSTKPRHALVSRPSKIIALLAASASVFILAACHLVGSGTVTSAYGVGRATFTFDLNCPNNGPASGVMNYVDTPARVMIRAIPTSGGNFFGNSCGTVTTITITVDGAAKPALSGLYGQNFSGTYTPLKGGTGGTFSVTLLPGGTNSTYPGFFSLALYGGVYDGYTNCGPIQWGNIVATN
jgi:hypothetical protein